MTDTAAILAELCNPKLVRLAQVPHRTADREDPKLVRRKWQPPHNMGEPQTENTLDNTFKHRNCTNGQILRSGSKLIEAGDYTSIKQGRPVWQPEGIMVVTIDIWETRMDPQGPMWYLLLQRE